MPPLPGYAGTPDVSVPDDLESVARSVRGSVDEPAVWLGWSLGGLVALTIARQAPSAVHAVVLVASNPCFVQREDWPWGVAPRVLDGFAEALEEDREGTLRRFLALQTRGAEDGGTTLRQLRARLDAAPAPSPAALRGGLEILRSTDLRGLLEGLTVPVFGIYGARDTLVPAAVAEWLAARPGCTARTIPGAGHAPFLSHPEVFLEALHGYTGGLEKPHVTRPDPAAGPEQQN